MSRIILGILIIIALIFGLVVEITRIDKVQAYSTTVIITKEIEVPVEIIRYVPINVTNEIIREIPIEVNKEIVREVSVVTPKYYTTQQFFKLEYLQDFIVYYKSLPKMVFMKANGSTANTCQYYANYIQQLAAEKGYDFPTEVLTIQELWAYESKEIRALGLTVDRQHMINKAVIGEHGYYYDYLTDKLWQAW